MPTTDVDVLIIHPLKHHLYHSVRGVRDTGASYRFVTLMYDRGIVSAVGKSLSSRFSEKVAEYAGDGIAAKWVVSPPWWQVRRVCAKFFGGLEDLVRTFDEWCAGEVAARRWRARAYHVVQDYVPLTARAIKEAGSRLVVEETSNSSAEARERARATIADGGMGIEAFGFSPDEAANSEVLAIADHVICPNKYTLGGVASRCRQASVWVIPYGVDTEAFACKAPAWEAPGPSLSIAARANTPRKGAHILLGALPSLAAATDSALKVRWRMLGKVDGGLFGLMKRCRASLGPNMEIGDGHVPHREVPAMLRASDLFVMPAISESMSLAALEAAATGLPLAVTPYCGLDAFEDGRHGFLIEEATIPALVRALSRAFAQREKWPLMG